MSFSDAKNSVLVEGTGPRPRQTYLEPSLKKRTESLQAKIRHFPQKSTSPNLSDFKPFFITSSSSQML
jgi:hypothetical protein